MKLKIILSLLGFMVLYAVFIFGGLRFVDWLFEKWNDKIALARHNRGKPKSKQKRPNKKSTKYKGYSMKKEKPVRWSRLMDSYIMLWIVIVILIILVAIFVP